MNESVTQADYSHPRNLGVRVAAFRQNPACGLADYLQKANQSKAKGAVPVEVRTVQVGDKG